MKYKLTSNTKQICDVTLTQIEAVTSFSDVEQGDLGGWIESENNLSQTDNAWVYSDAKVYGNAWVSDNAEVYGHAKVSGNAEVCGHAKVSGNAWVSDNAEVYGNAQVCGDMKIDNRNQIINIIGSPYIITITPEQTKIGCQQHLNDEWRAFDDKQWVSFASDALEFKSNWWPMVELGMRQVEGKGNIDE